MERQRNRYEGNKKIAEDEATYPDYRTIAFINLVADLAVQLTLAKMQPNEPAPLAPWLQEAKRRKKTNRTKRKNPRKPSQE